MRHVSAFVPARVPEEPSRRVRMPDFCLSTKADRMRLAEEIRRNEDYPVSYCWRGGRKWVGKR